jgi:hypothetical protein
MSDVLAELGAIRGGLQGRGEVDAACRRVESLFEQLRSQFLSEVVFSEDGFLGRSPGR